MPRRLRAKDVPEKIIFKRTKDASVYTYQFKIGGQRYGGTTRMTDHDKAYAFAADLYRKTKAAHVLKGHATPVQGPKDATIEEVAMHYLQFMSDGGTISKERAGYIAWIVRNIGRTTKVSAITNDTVIKLRRIRRNEPRVLQGSKDLEARQAKAKPLAAATINRTVIEPLSALHNHAQLNMGIPLCRLNFKDLRLKEAPARDRELTYEEEAYLRANVRADYWALMDFAMRAGLRLENFTALRWSEVDIDRKVAKVVVKGGKNHIINLTAEMLAIVEAQRGHHREFVFTYVFEGGRGGSHTSWALPSSNWSSARPVLIRGDRYPVTYSGFSTWFNRARNRWAKDLPALATLRIHDLRRTCGGRMADAGLDLQAVQKHLGHSSIVTTAKHYAARVDERRIRAALDAQALNDAELLAQAVIRGQTVSTSVST